MSDDGDDARPGPTGEPTVGDLVRRYLLSQRDAMRAGETDLRDGRPAVHPTRVGTRRFRSSLRTFQPIFVDGTTTELNRELRWYAAVLGEVRDREVQRERLAQDLAELTGDQIRGPVGADVEQVLLLEQQSHTTALLDVLDGPRYQALITALDEFLADPPWSKRAGRPATAARKYVRRADKTMRRLLAAGLASDEDHELHEARKAGKRARYAVELAGDAAGRQAAERLAELTAVQTELGEFQDSIVAADLLLRLGSLAERSGRPGFTYGLLYQRERERADAARQAVMRLAADA